MKIILPIILLVNLSVAAHAHSGHLEAVNGHEHTLLELVWMSGSPFVLPAVLVIGLFVLRRRG